MSATRYSKQVWVKNLSSRQTYPFWGWNLSTEITHARRNFQLDSRHSSTMWWYRITSQLLDVHHADPRSATLARRIFHPDVCLGKSRPLPSNVDRRADGNYVFLVPHPEHLARWAFFEQVSSSMWYRRWHDEHDDRRSRIKIALYLKHSHLTNHPGRLVGLTFGMISAIFGLTFFSFAF